MKKNLAWHFVGDKLGDGRPVPEDGVWLEHTGPLVMCSSGLHFSRHPFDALTYAPGSTLCLVEIGGEIIEPKGDNKGICSRRKIVKRGDMTELLRYFSRQQALSVVHLWDAPDVVLDYLMTGDESARAAARDAVWAAAWATSAAAAAVDAAAWAAADAAAEAAARDAAWAAARDAAWATSAADAAAGDAADAAAAAGEAQREYFLMLVEEAFS